MVQAMSLFNLIAVQDNLKWQRGELKANALGARNGGFQNEVWCLHESEPVPNHNSPRVSC